MSGAGHLSSNLCQSCGLCCSGVLFTHTTLTVDEVAWAEKRHLVVLTQQGEKAEKSMTPQPCPLHVRTETGAVCSAYEERPDTCRGFRCKLLRAFEEGEIDEGSARATIDRVRALAATVHETGHRSLTPESPLERLLDLGELEALLARHFRNPPKENEDDVSAKQP